MQLQQLAVLLGSLSMGAATSTVHGSLCGNEVPSEETLEQLQAMRAAEDAGTLPSLWSQEETLNIDLHLHGVIDPGKDAKTLTEAGMRAQFDVMNKAYAPYGIQFALASTDFTSDAELAHFAAMEDWDGSRVDFLRGSRKGGYGALNLWFYTSMPSPTIGLCHLPDRRRRLNESDWLYDGCHLLGAAMPGGDCEGFTRGLAAVHEAGHWFGLLHPWGHKEKDCGGPGDEIADTPAQTGPVFGCPAKPKDSCPDQPGNDNADNYMDYADDTCFPTKKFTPNQVSRMHNNYAWYRL